MWQIFLFMGQGGIANETAVELLMSLPGKEK